MLEIIRTLPRVRISYALFDYDGTLSLIRAGWQKVMIPMMAAELLKAPCHESKRELMELVSGYIDESSGVQTIYQMFWLVDRVKERGLEPASALAYKHRYLALLNRKIEHRRQALKSGQLQPDQLMVPGAREMLEDFQKNQIHCYLASGTDQSSVVEEAGLLGISHFFKGIYGAHDEHWRFSKEMIIKQLITENQLQGPELVVFEDSPLGIEKAKEAGCIAIGVASNETTRTGINSQKRERLIKAGSDIIIPDFREHKKIINHLLPA